MCFRRLSTRSMIMRTASPRCAPSRSSQLPCYAEFRRGHAADQDAHPGHAQSRGLTGASFGLQHETSVVACAQAHGAREITCMEPTPQEIAADYIARWERAWNSHGASATANLYTRDGMLVGGAVAVGKDEIEQAQCAWRRARCRRERRSSHCGGPTGTDDSARKMPGFRVFSTATAAWHALEHMANCDLWGCGAFSSC